MNRLILAAVFLAGQSALGQEFASNGDPVLAGYIERALEANPGVGQAFAQYRGAVARVPQVASLADPMLAFTNYLRTPETRVGAQTNAVTLSQQFPWFGALGVREQVAAKEAAAARQRYEASKQQLIRQVKIAYYSLAFVDRALEINDAERLLVDHYEELAEARYQQGVGLQQPVVKLQAEITRVETRAAGLRLQRVDAEAALNALLNRPAETVVARAVLPEIPAVAVDYARLYETGRRNRPEVVAALLQIERDEKRVELARKDYWPSFTLGGTYVNVDGRAVAPGAMPIVQNGKNVVSVNLGVSLPVHRSKYDAEVEEAVEARNGSTLGYRETVNQVEAAIRQTGFRITTLGEQIGLYTKTLGPQAEQSLASAESGYSTGGLGVLDLLDSERTLLDVRLGLAQMTSEYMKSLAEMERAIGTAFPEVVQ